MTELQSIMVPMEVEKRYQELILLTVLVLGVISGCYGRSGTIIDALGVYT